MRRCPNCGNELGEWTFCNKCGTKVEEILSSSQNGDNSNDVSSQKESRKCPKCGNELGNWVFCNKCGTNVEDYVASEPERSFVNSVANRQNILDQLTSSPSNAPSAPVPNQTNNSTQAKKTSDNIVPPSFYNRRNQNSIPKQTTPPNRVEPSHSTTQNTNNKKPIIIAASVIGVLLVSVIVLVVALVNNKPQRIDYVSTISSENSNGNIPLSDNNDNSDSDYILMPNCENKKYSTVKSQLEEMGLKVSESYEFSDEVANDYVIYQMDGEGSQLHKGDSVSLIISKGSDKCPYDYEQKLTVTASGSSSYATAVLYEWQEGDWSKIATYDATVGSNGIGNTREGSSTSPKGIHKLGVVLSSNNVSTNMDTYSATSNTCVIDDTSSSYYNQIMEKSSVPSGTHYDNIGRGLTDGSTYATIYIEHNGSGFSTTNVVSGNGSAIGLRGQNGSLSPTYGDVDISASDMRDLLSKLDYNKKPVIELNTK